jgi:hypothetical protein
VQAGLRRVPELISSRVRPAASRDSNLAWIRIWREVAEFSDCLVCLSFDFEAAVVKAVGQSCTLTYLIQL